jgi:hypothetical protein
MKIRKNYISDFQILLIIDKVSMLMDNSLQN